MYVSICGLNVLMNNVRKIPAMLFSVNDDVDDDHIRNESLISSSSRVCRCGVRPLISHTKIKYLYIFELKTTNYLIGNMCVTSNRQRHIHAH